MKGELSSDTEVKVPAGEVWKVYGGIQLAHLIHNLLPDVIGKTQHLQGDGGVGTIIKLTYPPQAVAAARGGASYMKEMFVTIDDEKRIKETEVIEGGYMELGFKLFRIRLEILEKDEATSIIRSTVIYEVDQEHAANASLVSTKPFETIATVVGNYIANHYKPSQSM